MDIFCEYMVKRKKGSREITLIIFFVCMALFVSYILLNVWGATLVQMTSIPAEQAGVYQIITSFMFPLIVALWWGLVVLLRRFSVEFEYTLTESELDIDKITSKKKRKRILNVNVRTLEIIAPVNSTHFTQEYKAIKAIDASSSQYNDKVYFAAFRKDEEKKILIFEPTQKMLAIIKRYCPEKTFINE